MIQENKRSPQHPLNQDSKKFLQPLALVLVCIVFIILILFIGIMDFRRLDNTLLGLMQTRGLDIIGNIQRVAQGNYSSLNQLLEGDHGSDALSPFSDETFASQDLLIKALVGLSKRIDQSWDSPQSGNDEKNRVAEREALWLIALIDPKGQVVFQSRPVEQTLLNRAAVVVSGRKDISLDLFDRSGGTDRLGLLAVRRSSGKGTIVMALDEAGLRFWNRRVAVQRAIDEAGASKGIAYVSVTDEKGLALGRAGETDEKWRNEAAVDLRQRKNLQVPGYRKISLDGKEIMEIVGPVVLDGKVAGVARIGLERDRAGQILQENRNNMFISLASIILIGLLSIWFLFQNQNRHLKRIEEMSKRLQQSERLSSLGQLAAGVAHEIRNPLNAISMASQRLQREYRPLLDPEKGTEFLGLTGVIRDEIRRLNGIIEEFLNFSRRDRLELKDYPIEDILQKLASLIEEEAGAKGIVLRREWDSRRSLIRMDIDKLQQALLNIVKNGMESIDREGSLTMSVDYPEAGWVVVRIADTGSGLTQEEIDRIFSPEYTTKEKGLGLGLPIAHEIVRAHGGDIRVKSQPGAGSTFEIKLPMNPA